MVLKSPYTDLPQNTFNVRNPNVPDDWTVEKFLSIMEVLPQEKDLSESQREMLFPSSGSHLELAQWEIYLYCFVLKIELHQQLDNRTLLFMKDAKTLRDKLLANPSGVEKSELLNLCDYLDNPLKDDMLRIFEREHTFADMMHANIVLQSWKRDEDKDNDASCSASEVSDGSRIMEEPPATIQYSEEVESNQQVSDSMSLVQSPTIQPPDLITPSRSAGLSASNRNAAPPVAPNDSSSFQRDSAGRQISLSQDGDLSMDLGSSQSHLRTPDFTDSGYSPDTQC